MEGKAYSSNANFHGQALPDNLKVLSGLLASLQRLVSASEPTYQERLQEIMMKSTPLLRQILGRLVSRNVQRATEELFSPDAVEVTLPSVLQVLELVSRVVPNSEKGKERRVGFED